MKRGPAIPKKPMRRKVTCSVRKDQEMRRDAKGVGGGNPREIWKVT